MKTKFGCQKMSGLKRAKEPRIRSFQWISIVYLSFVVYKQRTQPLQNCAPTKAGDASFLSPFGAHFMCQVSSSALTPSFCGRIKCSHFVQRLFISGTFLPLYQIYSIYKVWLYRLAYQQIKVIIRYQIILTRVLLFFFFLNSHGLMCARLTLLLLFLLPFRQLCLLFGVRRLSAPVNSTCLLISALHFYGYCVFFYG